MNFTQECGSGQSRSMVNVGFTIFISDMFPSVPKILGVPAFYHDSALALMSDGVVVAAAQEERFTREKHDHNFPTHAVEYCLREVGICAEDLDGVVCYDKPLRKGFDRSKPTYWADAEKGVEPGRYYRQF